MKPGFAGVLRHRFVRFVLVGGLNTAFGYAVFCLLAWTGLHYSAAIALSTIIGVMFNYHSTGRLVFDGAPSGRILRFFGVYGLTYAINVLLMKMLLGVGLSVYVAGASLILPMALLNFALMKRLVFQPA